MNKLQKLRYEREQNKGEIAQAEKRVDQFLDQCKEKKGEVRDYLKSLPEVRNFLKALFYANLYYRKKERLDKQISRESSNQSRDKLKNRVHQANFRARQKSK